MRVRWFCLCQFDIVSSKIDRAFPYFNLRPLTPPPLPSHFFFNNKNNGPRRFSDIMGFFK